jgi:hypothetical protein
MLFSRHNARIRGDSNFFSSFKSRFLVPGFFFLLLTAHAVTPASAPASDEPFTYPANWGGTGLMEIPTARIMKVNSLRIGGGQVYPYRYFYGAISPLKGLEIDGRITEELDVPSGLVDQKHFKDKAIDLKYQFLPEGKYMPAIALGLMDSHGTRIFPSQYVVASKQIYPFDFTIGFGNGRFGEKPLIAQTENYKVEMISNPKDWLKDSQFFGGIQFSPSEKFALMAEYSPILYHKQTPDPAQPVHFLQPVSSKFNFGMRYKPTKWSEIDVSYQRGEEFGVNFSVAFDIGEPLLPIYNPVAGAMVFGLPKPGEKQMAALLHQSGFSDIGVSIIENELWVTVQNDKYFYSTKALGVIIEIIARIRPKGIEGVHITLREKGITMVALNTTLLDLTDLYDEKLTVNEFVYLSDIDPGVYTALHAIRQYRKKVRYGIRPQLETFLNDPSGFFKYRLGVSGSMSYHPWDGASFVTEVATYPINNISTSNDPLSIPVRSDIVFYKENDFSMTRLMYDQIYKFPGQVYGKLSAGYLEIEYAGIDAEVAMPVLDGRILVGLGGSVVKKRDPDNVFEIKRDDVKDTYTTAFLNTRLNIPEQEMALDIKAGRFLAGDDGVRFTVSKFIRGVTIWAWYSFTDTSIFSDPFNDGYHDKGVGISIPLRLFIGTDSRSVFNYSLSPWTRDTGQDIDHYTTLFNFIGRNTKIFLDKDKQNLY